MRALAIVLGIAAIIVAAILSLQDNTARVSTVTRVITPLATRSSPAPSSTPVRQAAVAALPLPAIESPYQNILVREPYGVAVYDAAAARLRFRLPEGQVSADGNFYVTTVILGQETTIYKYDLETGERMPPGVLSGQWDLGAISAQGRWVTLTRVAWHPQVQGWQGSDQWKTTIGVYDMVDYGLAHSFDLSGLFDPVAISFDGGSLYLVEHLSGTNADRSQVRLYNLFTEQLQQGALADKRDPGEALAGSPWESLASPDGQWLITLYLRPDNSAFIYALNLKGSYVGGVDLTPGISNPDLLKHYSLALAPGGRILYAVNPALGTLTIVDLQEFQISRVLTFQARLPSAGEQYVDAPTGLATVSQLGNALFWSDGGSVWSFDKHAQAVQWLGEMPAPVLGLHASFDGRQLLAVGEDGQVHVLDSHIPAGISAAGQ